MNFNDYQQAVRTTAVYPQENKPEAFGYLGVALPGEVGELLNKVKKFLRGDAEYRTLDGQLTAKAQESMTAELGDCLWYLAELATHLGVSLESVADSNIAKLQKRADAGTVKGDGDNR